MLHLTQKGLDATNNRILRSQLYKEHLANVVYSDRSYAHFVKWPMKITAINARHDFSDLEKVHMGKEYVTVFYGNVR